MQRLVQPHAFYTDAAGKPLDAGYVYFGQAGQSPDTAPVAVYWDATGTTPAAQPLRTAGGHIVRDGQPADVFYSGTHSILVKDKNGVQVYADLNRTTNPDGYLTALTGAQITSGLGYTPANIAGQDYSGYQRFISAASDFNGGAQATLLVQAAPGNNAAQIQYERPANYGIKAGLDSGNNFAIGGWSMGAGVLRVYWDASGNQVTLGNVTAYSDLRRKAEITPINQPLARLLKMRGFTYLDTVTGQRKIGVGAQEVQAAGFGEAVTVGEDEHGTLSVAYGQLALPLLIESVRELLAIVQDQQKQINTLKGTA